MASATQTRTLTDKEVDRIRADFPVLAQRVHGKPLVYLDGSASSQKPGVMIDRLDRLYRDEYAHPEEGHALSKKATAALEGVREQVAQLINAAEAREIVFTRGATEAINLVSMSFQHDRFSEGDAILVTEAEHHSNIVPWLLARRSTGVVVKAAPIAKSGELDFAAFEALLDDRVRLVAVNHVSNVTGAVLPVRRVTEAAHERGIPVLVDGAQAVPHLPVDVRAIGCEFYAGSGHKMGGPSSVGFLYGQASVMEEIPLADGGSTMADSVTFDDVVAKPPPHRFEAGEPAFGEVVGWGPAIDYWQAIGLERIETYERELTTMAVEALDAISGVRLVGSPEDRISVVSFVVDGVAAADVATALDKEGIAVRAGKLESEPQLKALGFDEAVRASFSFYNTRAEVEQLQRVVRGTAKG